MGADLNAIVQALSGQRHALRAALPALEPKAGLYAIYGDHNTWDELGLGVPPDDRPLYVGKAEDSVVKRDLETHFGDGKTGGSTVRRSFAALLRDTLGLTGRPRNLDKPGYFPSYGLSPADDAKLTGWMRDRLQLAVWATDQSAPLGDLEDRVLQHWLPPINIRGVRHGWRADVKAARKVMADQARAWRPGTG